MATLKDVAKRAGVSVATVSCCLSGAKNVKYETKLRVMQAVEDLHYIPNAAARELRTTKTNKIGLVLPDIDDGYYNGILKGVSQQLRSEFHILNMALSYQNSKFECEKIDELIHANVGGLIVITCQPENTDFFTSRVAKYGIPTVFVHHKPTGMDTNYLAFDNYATTKYLTAQLLSKGYRDIALILGDRRFSAEQDAYRGVQDAYDDQDLLFQKDRVYIVNMTKENAFQATMIACRTHVPHAFLSTSAQMTLGIKEALDLQGIRVPEDTVLVTLGVESWNRTNQLPGVIYTRRSADVLGATAATLLLDIMRDGSQKISSTLFTDEIIHHPLDLLPRKEKAKTPAEPHRKLRILCFDSPSVRALEMLSSHYGKRHDVEVEFVYKQISSLLQHIQENAAKEAPDYDLVYFDTPWTEYLASQNWLEDLSTFSDNPQWTPPQFIHRYADNATSYNKQIGFPVLGGTQIMFYRKDLFENPAIMSAYKEHSGATLRPPKTWQEYNRIAAFFTRSLNAASPTLYGTAFAGISDEYLSPELMPRLWSNGVNLTGSNGKPKLTSKQCLRAYELMQKTLDFAPPDSFSLDAEAVTSLFCSGDVAMIIAFTEYAGEIRDSLNKQVITNIGYAALPERTDMKAGWNLGVCKNSPNKDLIFSYFQWFFEARNSFYYTILGGQATTSQPYDNGEIIGLYPWMELTKQHPTYLYSLYNRGIPPHRSRAVIPSNRVEAILCNVLRRTTDSHIPLTQSLEIAQREMETLLQKYGYQ